MTLKLRENKDDVAGGLTPKDYKDAIDVQDACNLSGVVHELSRVLPRIRAEVQDTDAINTHPIVRMYVDKLCHLSKLGEHSEPVSNSERTIYTAYAVCRDRSEATCEQSEQTR